MKFYGARKSLYLERNEISVGSESVYYNKKGYKLS